MKKTVYTLWISITVVMIIAIIIGMISGCETVKVWDFLIWVIITFFTQLMLIGKQKEVDGINTFLQIYKKKIDDKDDEIEKLRDLCSDANSAIKKYLTGDKKEVWNIVIQKWDKTGSEEHYSIDSFVTEELARKKYHEWLEEDKRWDNINVEETPGILEYWYTWESGEMTRVKVIKSYLFE